MGNLKRMMTHRPGGTFGGSAFARLTSTTESICDLSEMTRGSLTSFVALRDLHFRLLFVFYYIILYCIE